MKTLRDTYGRVHDYLRISVTDKCNLHCVYCNPAQTQNLHSFNAALLTIQEIFTIISMGVEQYGITKIRLTGGEPLIRKDIDELFVLLRELKSRIPFSLGITTNGILLKDKIGFLAEHGLNSINISVDSLRRMSYNRITQHDTFDTVLAAVNAVKQSSIPSLKINCVVMRGINDREIIDFVHFAIQNNLNVRFIEYMPFTNNGWSDDLFISYGEMKKNIESQFHLIPLATNSHAVAKDYLIEGHPGTISFITSVSEHFCAGCNRIRIAANGTVKPCLFSIPDQEIHLTPLLRSEHGSVDDIYKNIQTSLLKKWEQHPDTAELSRMKNNQMLSIGG